MKKSNSEITERLIDNKPKKKKKRVWLIILLVLILIIGIVFAVYLLKPELFSFLPKETKTEESVQENYSLGNGSVYNDNFTHSDDQSLRSESGNTTGNFGNYGKAVTVGNVNYFSTYYGSLNCLWKQEGGQYTKLYENYDETNGINDLQYFNGKLYMKSGGIFGEFNLGSNEFNPIELGPGTPVSPRIYGKKIYYLTYTDVDAFYLYQAELDGTGETKVAKLDSGLGLGNYVAFAIKFDKAYLFINTIIGDYTTKESKIETINLKSGAKTTIYTTNGYIDEFVTYSQNSLYFLESDSRENTHKSIYRIPLDSDTPILFLDGSERHILTINSNKTAMYYLDGDEVFKNSFKDESETLVGEISSQESDDYKPFLLLGNNLLMLEIRTTDSEGFRTTEFYEANIKDNTDLAPVELNYGT